MRKRLTAAIAALALALTCFAVPVDAASNSLSRIGDKNRTVKVGQEFELAVKKPYSGFSDNNIKWTSSNTSVVKYDDDDRYDNDMEFKAVKAGKSTITAYNKKTGGKIYYYVTVKNSSSNKGTLSRIGDKNRSVKAGQEFELAVKKPSGMSDNNIKWTSSNTSVVKYDDDDRYDNDMEFKAVKAGKATITALNRSTGGKIYFYVTVKENSGSVKISRVGNATKYVEVDDDLELKVKKGSGLKSSQIKWYISDSSLLSFEDGDRYGTSIEVESKYKTGTAKVTAKNLKTGDKIVYTVKIVPEDDD